VILADADSSLEDIPEREDDCSWRDARRAIAREGRRKAKLRAELAMKAELDLLDAERILGESDSRLADCSGQLWHIT
jgi:hypothetical protein